MKKYFKNICLAAVALMFAASCSNVDPVERWYDDGAVIAERMILVEDYTGQKCVNCPTGTEVLHDQTVLYNENVVVVAIHSGGFGVSKPTKIYETALMTDLGKTYWEKYFEAGQGQPVIKIDRRATSDDYKNWPTEIAKRIVVPEEMNMSLDVVYNADSREVTVKTKADSDVELADAKLQLWLIEDGIVATQSMPNGDRNKEYVHNHVLREAVNGEWGEDAKFENGAFENEKTFTLGNDYKAENCAIVAFIYTEKDGVQIVRKSHL